MPTHYGLYHPFIHFQDEGWLKLTALYWDGMFRIVPDAIAPNDSDEVKVLVDGGFVDCRHPGIGAYRIAEPFKALIAKRGDELSHKFSVNTDDWKQLDRIHLEKMEDSLVQDLVDCHLATVQGSWLSMQPRLASVYMTALADVMAPMIGARPITETSLNHIAVSGLTLERLADALLGRQEAAIAPNDSNEIEMAMASLAISYVVPENPNAISAKAINEFRKEFAEERALFQTEVNKLVQGLEHLKEVKDPREVEKHLKNAYEKGIGPRLTRLKKAMTRTGWDTVDSATAASFAIPQGLAAALHALGFSLTGTIATAAGIALTGWSILRKSEKAKVDILKPSSESFLYRLEQSLKPDALVGELFNDSQKFLPYV